VNGNAAVHGSQWQMGPTLFKCFLLVNRLYSSSLKVVRGRQSDFDFFLAGERARGGKGHSPLPDLTPVIEHFGIFSETHPKQSQRDVSLQMYYCASSVCGGLLGYLDVSMLVGWGGISSHK